MVVYVGQCFGWLMKVELHKKWNYGGLRMHLTMYLRLYANYIRGVQKMCQRGNNRNNHLYNNSLKKGCDYYVSLLTRNINLTKLLAQRKWSVKIYLRAFVQTKFSHILLKTEQPWGQWWVIFKINLRTEKNYNLFQLSLGYPFYIIHIIFYLGKGFGRSIEWTITTS